MLRNYLIIAWKGLFRHKFVTVVSLLGIGLTLMVLTVLVAYLESYMGNTKPEVNRDKSLYLNQMTEKYPESGTSIGSPSYFFLKNYVATLQTPKAVSISSYSQPLTVHGKSGKVSFRAKYADAAFWRLNEFDFVAGQNFTNGDVESGASVVVIGSSMAKALFGGEPASGMGKKVVLAQKMLKVVGVVKDPKNQGLTSFSEMWIPISLSDQNLLRPSFLGNFSAQVLAHSSSDFEKIIGEYDHKISSVTHPDQNSVKSFSAPLITHQEYALNTVFLALFETKSPGALTFYAVLATLVLIIMLIPAINLININSSRIRDRLGEIGIRKAFGASERTLIGQFLTENVFLCLLGGVVGLLFSIFIISLLNQANVLKGAYLTVNFTVFFTGFLLTVFFGVLSGVIPAYKMSRLQIVNALKKQRS